MLKILTMFVLFGLVVQSGGTVYTDVANHGKLNLKACCPNNTELTKALKASSEYVGFTYSKSRPYIVLKFNNVNNRYKYCLVYKSLSTVGDPLFISIYISRNGHNWDFVKTEIAGAGKHIILLPYAPTYVKLVGVGSKYGGMGATQFETIYLKRCNNSFVYIFSLKDLTLFVCGNWLNSLWIASLFLSIASGLYLFISDRHCLILAVIGGIFITLVFAITQPFDVSPYVLTAIYFFVGCLIGIIYKCLKNCTYNTKN